MKRLLAITLAFCLLFAVGCAKEEPAPEPPAPAPAPEPAPEPEPAPPTAEGGEVVEIRNAEDIGSGVYTGNGEFISNLGCDAGLLSFTLNNPTGHELVFGRISPLESSDYGFDQIAKILINGRRLDIEKYCGLEGAKFPTDGTATCSIEFTPDNLRSEVLVRVGMDDLGEKMVNQVTIKAGEHYEGEFTCGEGEPASRGESGTVEEYVEE